MANPQLEDGYTPIANDIVEALMKVNLSSYESRILWFLFRKTYGWGKKTDWLALSQFSKDIGIDRRLVHRAIKGLSSKKMIVIERDDNGKIRYGLQKDFDKWELSSKKMTVIKRDDRVSSKEMTRVSSNQIPTKENITKENITKEIELPDGLSKETFSEYLELRKKLKRPLIEKSYPRFFSHLLKICKETRASPESIINQSLVNSWQGIFPLKQEDNYANTTTGYKKPISQIRGNFRSEQRGLDPKTEAEADRIAAEYYARKAAAGNPETAP